MISTVRFLPLLSLGLVLTSCGSDAPTTSTPTPVGQNGYTLISPNGGESFRVGGTIHIKWNITDPTTSSASPYLRCGTEWFNLITNNSIGNLSVDTNILLPDSLYSDLSHKTVPTPTGNTCKLKVKNYQGGTPFDTSDAVFIVAAK
jgi:hypothetical protein